MHIANQLTLPQREGGRGAVAHVTSTRISAGQEAGQAGRSLTAAISVCDSSKGRNKLQLSNATATATANANSGRTHLPGLVARMWAAACVLPLPHPLPLPLPLLPLLLSLMCQRHCQRLQLLSMQRGERQEALQLLLVLLPHCLLLLLLQPFSGTWWSVQASARPRAWESHSV